MKRRVAGISKRDVAMKLPRRRLLHLAAGAAALLANFADRARAFNRST